MENTVNKQTILGLFAALTIAQRVEFFRAVSQDEAFPQNVREVATENSVESPEAGLLSNLPHDA